MLFNTTNHHWHRDHHVLRVGNGCAYIEVISKHEEARAQARIQNISDGSGNLRPCFPIHVSTFVQRDCNVRSRTNRM